MIFLKIVKKHGLGDERPCFYLSNYRKNKILINKLSVFDVFKNALKIMKNEKKSKIRDFTEKC